jgi:hypothetical protein
MTPEAVEGAATVQHLGQRLGAVVSNPAVPSLYVWAATVGVPVVRPGAGWGARLAAGLGLACIGGAVYLLARNPRLARVIGIYAFVGLCVLSWVLLGEERLFLSHDPARQVLGALGWAAFAFGWGAVRSLGSVPEEHPAALRGQPLQARARLPRHSSLALTIGLAGAALCLFLAWRIDRPAHAVLGHVVALAGSAGLLAQAGRLAARRSEGLAPAGVRTRVESAAFALSMLGITLAVGVVTWLLLRR